ncbi:MAG: radical SAM protein [Proteobacteria bacterium]|nr:radical SAM protein [Pseudomonadota bacterium]
MPRLVENAPRVARLIRLLDFDRAASLGPLLLELSLTSACNYRCYFCYAHSHLKRETVRPGNLAEDVYEGLIRDILALKVPEVRLAGSGEPLLYPGAIRMIERYGSRFKINLVTNGRYLDKVTPLIFRNLNKLTVSLNSLDPEVHQRIHGYAGPSQLENILERTRALLALPDAGRKLQINYVLSDDNHQEIGRLLDLARSWNVMFCIRPLAVDFEETRPKKLPEAARLDILDRVDRLAGDGRRLPPRFRDSLEYLRQSLQVSRGYSQEAGRLPPCYAGFYGGFIESNGDYKMCCHCDRAVGNLNESSFLDLWRSRAVRRARFNAALMDRTGRPVCGYCYDCPEAEGYSALFHRYYIRLPGLYRRMIRHFESLAD